MTTRTVETKWYKFRQNNSGGRFRKPAINVYIEAMDAVQANSRAVDLDIYFGGVGDCSCCGDRWERASEYNAQTEEPTEEVTDAVWGTADDIPEGFKFRLGENGAILLSVQVDKAKKRW